MDIESNYIYDKGYNEWIEIVIVKDPPIAPIPPIAPRTPPLPAISDAEKEKQWAVINHRELKRIHHKNPFGCENCVWGIQSMENTYPIYCTCLYGQRHTNNQPPFFASLGGKIIEFFKYFWSDKN